MKDRGQETGWELCKIRCVGLVFITVGASAFYVLTSHPIWLWLGIVGSLTMFVLGLVLFIGGVFTRTEGTDASD